MPKVLIADDSMAVRKVAERHLVEAGMDVALAANGEEAISLLTQVRPDILVCDVIMPDKSGYDVCTFTRSHATLSGTPVLLISGIVNQEVTAQAKTCGADAVLKKPFMGTSLKDHVLELLAKGRAPRESTAPASSPAPSSAGTVGAASTPTAQVNKPRSAPATEQDRTAQPGQQTADVARLEARIKELESALEAERTTVADVNQQLAAAESEADHVKELERAVEDEGKRVAALTEQLAKADGASGHASEFESLLADERKRIDQMAQRLGEAKQAAERAAAREQELINKLSRIANLSQ